MKNFQVRLADEVYEAVKELAQERGDASIADVVRESLESYVMSCMYARDGRRLFWEDSTTGEKAEVLIPRFSLRSRRQRSSVGA